MELNGDKFELIVEQEEQKPNEAKSLVDGDHICKCRTCKEMFFGYKGMITCKECYKEIIGENL